MSMKSAPDRPENRSETKDDITKLSFGYLGTQLFARGLPVIPLEGKRPILRGWVKQSPKEAEVNSWAREHSAANVGLLCGHDDIAAIDMDIYDPKVSEAIQKAFGYLHNCPVRVGQAPKSMFLCRVPGLKHKLISAAYDHIADLPGKGEAHKNSRIEVMSHGQQCAIAGIHPDTGQPYTGLDYDSLSLESLPIVPLEDCYFFLDMFEALATKAGWRKVADRPKRSQWPKPKHGTEKRLRGRQGRRVLDQLPQRTDTTTLLDDFNANGHEFFVTALLNNGWRLYDTSEVQFTDKNTGQLFTAKTERFTRPGKENGVSATLFRNPFSEQWRFHLFSSSIPEMEEGDYLISHAYCLLSHEGDYTPTIAALKEAGFVGGSEKQQAVLQTYSFGQFHTMHFPLPVPLIGTDGRAVLVAGEGMLIVGRGGEGKTSLTLDAAMKMALGIDVFGFPIPRPLRVLHLQAEIPPAFYQRLVQILVEGYQLVHPDISAKIKDKLFHTLFTNVPNVSEESGLSLLRKEVEIYRPDIVILDPYLSFFQHEENDNGKTRAALDRLKHQVLGPFNCGAVIVDHQGKAANVPGQEVLDARGASAKRDWACTTVALRKNKTPEGQTGEFVSMTFDKCRYLPRPAKAIILRREPVTGIYTNHEGEKVQSFQVGRILEELGVDVTKGDLVKKVRIDCEVSDHEARRVVDTAIDEGWIVSTNGPRNRKLHNLGNRYLAWKEDAE